MVFHILLDTVSIKPMVTALTNIATIIRAPMLLRAIRIDSGIQRVIATINMSFFYHLFSPFKLYTYNYFFFYSLFILYKKFREKSNFI